MRRFKHFAAAAALLLGAGGLFAAEFKASENTMEFGSKRLVVKPNGVFSIYSDGREAATVNFYLATHYGPGRSSRNLKDPVKYDGGDFCLTEFKADPATKSFVSKGIMPFHKKGEKAAPGVWTQTLTMLPGDKVDYKLEVKNPEGFRHRDHGIFIALPTADGYIFDYGHTQLFSVKQPNTRVGQSITVKTMNPDDAFRIETPTKQLIYANLGGRKTLRLGLHPKVPVVNIHLVFDLMKCGKAAPHSEGGVDLVKVDNLHLNTTGKNMLPNPYFAQGLMFLATNASCPLKLVPGGKFGKYCVTPDVSRQTKEILSYGAHWYLLAAVPGDRGKYVFSFYTKGKGKIQVVVKGQAVNWDWKTLPAKTFVLKSDDWQRHQFTFDRKTDGAISVWLGFSAPPGAKSFPYVDGVQLEKGTAATDFSAEKVTARLITDPPDGFFESGKPMSAALELSTLDSAKGTGTAVIRDFFGKTLLTHSFKFDFRQGEYPRIELPVNGKLPDGIHVMEVTYDMGKKNVEYFRFGVMPWLKNEHATAPLFSMEYFGGKAYWFTNLHEDRMRRMQQVGIGSLACSPFMMPEMAATYKKYNILLGDISFVSRTTAAIMRKIAPDTPVKPEDGNLYFYVRDPDSGMYSNQKALIVDYNLVGGWTPEYRKKFIEVIAGLTRRFPENGYYSMGSEWPQQIKSDPHYPDLFAAFREAVLSVYPKAKVFERGFCNMEPREGTAYVGDFLRRAKERGIKTDAAATHTYTKEMPRLYDNFRDFVDTVNRCGGKDMKMLFPEGGHFYPYCIPQWNIILIGWLTSHGNTWGAGVLSYDMGNAEKLSAAYYARLYLIFLTEFKRVILTNSSAQNVNNFALDMNLVPRAFQKVPNTLGILFGNPKRYLGDHTFSPDTRCLVWEDEKGRPLAAVWNEESAVDLGFKKPPAAMIDYPDAEYIDLMGNRFKPEKPGMFRLTSVPVFIRGTSGDIKGFIKAISTVTVDDPGKLPCRLGLEMAGADTVRLTVNNLLAKPQNGVFKVFGKEHKLAVPGNGRQELSFKLSKAVRAGRVENLQFPYECEINGRRVYNTFSIGCFLIPKFKGSWDKIPWIKLENRLGKNRDFRDRDFCASYQAAWTKDKLLLRVKVTDDMFSPGTETNYRWNYDVVQLYFDTRCSALKTGKKGYDDDDYDFGLMPTADGKRCEVWRAIQPDIQLTLGVGAPKSGALAPEIAARFIRTADGYIYEAEFPAPYLLPIRFVPGYCFGFGIYAADKDKGKGVEKGVNNSIIPQAPCYNNPGAWPIAILTE